MASTPVKPPVSPPPAAKVNPSPPSSPPKPNPLHGPGLTEQEVREKKLTEERIAREQEEGAARAELETRATQERLERELANVAGPHYLSEQANQDEARIAMREESQAAVHRAPATGEKVPIVGSPPPANMRPDEPIPDEATLPESTRAEMAAGREGLKSYEARAKAEHEAGQKALRDHAIQHPDEPSALSRNPPAHGAPIKPGDSEE